MKRIAPPSRHGGFLTQKKIRLYLDQPKESVKPLNQVEWPYEEERGNPLTAPLRYAMHHAVQPQLSQFKETEQPLSCAFNKDHTRGEYVTSHYIRYFDELCGSFLKMFSSLRLPVEYDSETKGFIAKDEVFERAWTTFHLKRANLRILCKACHLLHTEIHYNNKKSKQLTVATSPLSLNEALKPYKKELAHPWLDILTWAHSNKGNYSRKLGDKQFTLFHRDNKWNYVYDNKFGATKHDTVKQVLHETYETFGETIRRFL